MNGYLGIHGLRALLLLKLLLLDQPGHNWNQVHLALYMLNKSRKKHYGDFRY